MDSFEEYKKLGIQIGTWKNHRLLLDFLLNPSIRGKKLTLQIHIK